MTNKMNTAYILLVIVIVAMLLASSDAESISQPLFLSCGLSKSTNASSPQDTTRVWKSDDDPAFAPRDINSVSNTTSDTSKDIPLDTARVFSSRLTYSFSVSPGPKFIRVYFIDFSSSSMYNGTMSLTKAFLSLEANNVILFKNFSPYLNSLQNKESMYEFHLTVEKGITSVKNLNLTFTPGIGDGATDNYGFINAIEIVPIPEGLYINLNNITGPKDLSYTSSAGSVFSNFTALQNVFRLNVGGLTINPKNDSGRMWRKWDYDGQFLVEGNGTNSSIGGILPGTVPDVHYKLFSKYVAPPMVYATVRVMGKFPVVVNIKRKLTWMFEVDQGFYYFVRLHFCEMNVNVTGSGQRTFNVFINNQSATKGLDVFYRAGGKGIPIYQDYAVRVDGSADAGNASKVPLWLALQPFTDRYALADVLLNGLEIFKLSSSTNSLAAPNPPRPPSTPPTITTVGIDSNNPNHSLLIIGGAIGGTIVFSLVIFACVVLCKQSTKKEDTSFGSKSIATNTSSKYKWIPNMFHSGGSTASTTTSSLPSDICRHFFLAQIKIATCDFDKNLIIGKGGFGEVYKGSILNNNNNNNAANETIQVAIKRLHTKSKQGAREFQTEIEMLSRLRHVHLVSLIGYCEDEGEMILVYEYMSHGTLRDHLMYKNSERNDHNKTPMSWKQRLMICLGSARGLHYLHAGASQRIIHRDVKTTNILLDDNWTAKVSDFGLSKAGPISLGMGPTHISTAVKGSAGYLDPEYYQNHKLTEKSDVYSFGVVLFEVLCARAAVNPNLPKEQANLAMWAQSHYKKATLHTIVDPTISSQIAPECLRKFGEIAEMCVRGHGSERPSMADVVWGLEFALQLQQTAEKDNSLSGEFVGDVLGPTINVGDDGNTDNDVFTNSGDNFSRSTHGGVARKSPMDSKTTTSSSSDYQLNMKSNSVFSEIIDPTAR